MQLLEERVAYLQRSVSDISENLMEYERAIQALAAMMDSLQESGQSSSDKIGGQDRVWNCEKCGARLGVYDPDSEQLRIKYKDFSLYSVPGKGGSLTVPCRRCAHLNTLEDDR